MDYPFLVFHNLCFPTPCFYCNDARLVTTWWQNRTIKTKAKCYGVTKTKNVTLVATNDIRVIFLIAFIWLHDGFHNDNDDMELRIKVKSPLSSTQFLVNTWQWHVLLLTFPLLFSRFFFFFSFC